MRPQSRAAPREDTKHLSNTSSWYLRPVLCAIDASDEGRRVARGGAALAVRIGAPLVLLHVARSDGWHPVDELAHRDRHAADPDEATRLLEARAAETDVAASLVLREGEPVEQVLQAAEELAPSLLVMGARTHGLMQSILGSVSRQVARWTTRPTLVIPEAAQETAMAHDRPLLCGLDDSAPAARAAELAAGLAVTLGVALVILSVVDAGPAVVPTAPAAMPVIAEPPNLLERRHAAVRERANRVADRFGAFARTRAMVEIGDPARRIEDVGRDVDAGLIVVGTRQRSGLAAAFTGSVSRALASGSRPVLMVP
jgi:nucleotide-binding universal stress UspA family protein